MVVAEAAGALASSVMGVGQLWGYNRDNFLYDRKMRQKTEIQVAQWRAEQAGQWREDVRDLTGLTESKMASYMTVNTLQLSMCVLLFAEGRLQPGTPHWLLHLYMLTLSAAFMYLLMSVWLAMHASVVVACEKARLLTQFVRLPIPTWRQFENMRTSATAYEKLGSRSLRVPFMDTVFEKPSDGGNSDRSDHRLHNPRCEIHGALPMSASGMARVEANPTISHGAPEGFNDTWGLETQGDEVNELAERPLHSNRHVNLVRRAQTHYQCHDAFARISMTFGTNQLLMALSYFVLGYVSVGDGAPWPAIMITIIMLVINILLVQMDISFAREEKVQAVLLMSTGLFFSAFSTIAWCTSDSRWQVIPAILLPPAYLAHGLWLLWALRACQVQLLPGGEMLPTKFRLVMYLDVFGWISNQSRQAKAKSRDEPGEYMPMADDGFDGYSPVAVPTQASRSDSLDGAKSGKALTSKQRKYIASFRSSNAAEERARLVADIRQTLESWQSEDTMQKIDDYTKGRINTLARRFHFLGQTLSPTGASTTAGFTTGGFSISAEERAAALATLLPDASDDRKALDQLPSLLLPLNLPENERYVSEPDAVSEGSVETAVIGDCALSPNMARGPGSDPPSPQARFEPYRLPEPVTFSPLVPESSLISDELKVQKELSMRERLSRDGSSVSTGHPLLRSLSVAEDELDHLEELETLRQEIEGLEKLEHFTAKQGTAAGSVQQQRSFSPPAWDDTPRVKMRQEVETGERLRATDFFFSPRQFSTKLRNRSKHQMATALPWLFGDVEPNQGFDINDAAHSRTGSRHDCPNAVVVNSRGHVEKANDAGDNIDVDEIVIAMAPDKIPWQVFRYATLLLVFLWLISPLLLYGWYPYGRSEFGPQPALDLLSAETKGKSFAEREDPDGTFSGTVIDNRDMDYDLEPTIDQYESMPTLPTGQLLNVHWPFESNFAPRALTCDKTGKHVIVSDDFGVYSAKVVDGPGDEVEVEAPRQSSDITIPQEKAGEKERRLRGPPAARLLKKSLPPSSFSQMPHCTALEGKQLKDVGVVCGRGRSYCRVVVLHSNGRRLSECPLYSSWGSVVGSPQPDFLKEEQGEKPSDFRPAVRPLSDWRISGSWLDHDVESVESLAVNPECEQGEASPAEHAFDPAEVGCVVVGTSSGRVVQLRRHVSKEHDLVPEWAMQERRGKVAQGSLQVFPGGLLLMLRSEIALMQAINAEKGSLLGQWRLPDNAEWFSISGGGDSLFMLGRELGSSAEGEEKPVSLWKFPLPAELKKLFTDD